MNMNLEFKIQKVNSRLNVNSGIGWKILIFKVNTFVIIALKIIKKGK